MFIDICSHFHSRSCPSISMTLRHLETLAPLTLTGLCAFYVEIGPCKAMKPLLTYSVYQHTFTELPRTPLSFTTQGTRLSPFMMAPSSSHLRSRPSPFSTQISPHSGSITVVTLTMTLLMHGPHRFPHSRALNSSDLS